MPELSSTSVSGLKYTVVKCRYASPHVLLRNLHVLDRLSCVILFVSLTLIAFYTGITAIFLSLSLSLSLCARNPISALTYRLDIPYFVGRRT
jgi:hypothetical protein